MSEQAMDPRFAAAALRRRARFIAMGGVLGLAVGVGYVVSQPPHLTSTALVLSMPSGQQQGSSDVDAQARIASSDRILATAGKAVTPALSARDMQSRVRVSAATPQLVRISVWAPRSRDAQALAAATTDAYVHYVTSLPAARTPASTVSVMQRATMPVQQRWPSIPLSLWVLAGIAAGMLLSLRHARAVFVRTTMEPI